MEREEQGALPRLQAVDGYLPVRSSPVLLTVNERYLLDAFWLLSPTRQQAVLVVIGSMAVGD